jgi:ABC-type dipeptide/oligopeptide/nickel transport system permease component
MWRLALRRVALAVPVLFLVSVLSFLLLRAAPGNPAQLQAGLDATPKVVAAISRQLASTARSPRSTGCGSTASCTATSGSPTRPVSR